ncbi:hypothetical protein [Pontibacter rugosus]
MAGLSACSTQNSVLETQEIQEQELTLKDVIPAMAPKTAEAKAKQQKFLKTNTNRFKSRALGSAYYVLQAQRNFNDNKLDSATIHFNRAWLMDSTNNDVYWGYGLVYGRQEQHDKALFILYKALEKDQANARLLTDVATAHLARYYQNSNPKDLQQSEKLLVQALEHDPAQAADTFYKLAVNNYYQRNYRKAWEYLHESIKQDKEKEDDAFIAVLLEKEQDPQGIYLPQQAQ